MQSKGEEGMKHPQTLIKRARLNSTNRLPAGRTERLCFTSPRGPKEIEAKLFQLQHNKQVYRLCIAAATGEARYEHWHGFAEFHSRRKSEENNQIKHHPGRHCS
jgi:hypothetical protein